MKFYRFFFAALMLPLAFLYWPAACATPQALVSTPQEKADSGDTNVTPKKSLFAHPSVAFANGKLSAASSVADVAERVMPSVVSVASERVTKQPQMRFPFPFPFLGPEGPQPQERTQHGLGSGVIVSESGRILTNNHVIDDASEIKVTVPGGREYDAKVVGADAKSDLAVLQLKGDVKGLVPLPIGDSGKMRLGDFVLAVGNPFGIGQTVTMGIVSAKGRANVGIVDYEDFIQTDAAINPGNSGGALVNMQGELVGINTAILSRSGGYQGIGFAIPTNMAKPIIDSLVKHGKVVRGFLGVSIQDINPELADALGLKVRKGVLIAGVTAGSAADKAGLKRGDVVTAVDGVAMDSSGHLRNTIAGKGAGKRVELSVVRNDKPMKLTVQLGTLSESSEAADTGNGKGASGNEWGMQLAPLNKELSQRFGVQSKSGKVIVVAVKPGSMAEDAGVRPGDVILEVDKHKVTSVGSAKQLMGKDKSRVLMVLERGGTTRYVLLSK